ncbi:DUF3301 domain-containing protein [Nitrincola iocasae]|jgi:hypothetical protein|uniref:DUF3301 domain-containing protein n=1 Tax=Nitrincola iocasae TaxID=2614693 RepID=A0A5J6LC81_9GAMM|nr:DUF3301 domain-containing protein [Nitrincola iocasae]QEW06209.1 DUF3301 domain-containing protein [Nitrincola iocasae]
MWIDLTALIWMSLIALIALLWWQNLKVRELALKQVKRYCDREALQLLDQSVALRHLSMARNPHNGQLHLKRRYNFEFTSTGDERYQGHIELLGSRLLHIEVDAHRVP